MLSPKSMSYINFEVIGKSIICIYYFTEYQGRKKTDTEIQVGNENQSKFYIKKQYCNRRSIRHYRIVRAIKIKLSYVTFHTHTIRAKIHVWGFRKMCTMNCMLQSGSLMKIAFKGYFKMLIIYGQYPKQLTQTSIINLQYFIVVKTMIHTGKLHNGNGSKLTNVIVSTLKTFGHLFSINKWLL